MEKMYTCEAVAKRYGVKRETVWEWIRSGKMGATIVGKQYRVSEKDIHRKCSFFSWYMSSNSVGLAGRCLCCVFSIRLLEQVCKMEYCTRFA